MIGEARKLLSNAEMEVLRASLDREIRHLDVTEARLLRCNDHDHQHDLDDVLWRRHLAIEMRNQLL